jgi:hypothetical protein
VAREQALGSLRAERSQLGDRTSGGCRATWRPAADRGGRRCRSGDRGPPQPQWRNALVAGRGAPNATCRTIDLLRKAGLVLAAFKSFLATEMSRYSKDPDVHPQAARARSWNPGSDPTKSDAQHLVIVTAAGAATPPAAPASEADDQHPAPVGRLGASCADARPGSDRVRATTDCASAPGSVGTTLYPEELYPGP